MSQTREPVRRDYSRIGAPSQPAIHARMRSLVDSVWDELSPQGVSWVGFYVGPGRALEDGRVAGHDQMLLGPCRDKPACSPIGLHGVCGRGWRERRGIVVRDVAVLGSDYVACDPRDTSEVVVPLFDEHGCWGVLDIDSWEAGAFDTRDADVLEDLLARAGLTIRGSGGTTLLV